MMDIKFGTDGWRAVIGEGFNQENVNRVAVAVARYLASDDELPSKSPVLIGYDTRRYSAGMARMIGRILQHEGIEAYVSEAPVPTPAVAEAVVRLGYAAGLVVTASHNPSNFNGIKFKPWFGGSASSETTAAIERFMPDHSVVLPSGRRGIKSPGKVNLLHGYLAYLGRHIDFGEISKYPGKVVIEPMYGATQGLASMVVGLADVSVRELHRIRRPGLGGMSPEPIPPNIDQLQELVAKLSEKLSKAGGSAIGLAFDGDGDRIGAVDESGQFVNSHQIFAVLLDYMAGDLGLKGKVLKTVSTSSLVDAVAASYGLSVETTPVGFKYLCEGIRNGNVLIAGEESGGIHIQGTIPERDGVMCGLKLLEMLARRGDTLEGSLRRLRDKFGVYEYGRKDLHLRSEMADKVREHVALWEPTRLAGKSVSERVTIDGLKLVMDDGSWLMVRPSGTEPVLRVYSEAHSVADVEALISEGISALPSGSV